MEKHFVQACRCENMSYQGSSVITVTLAVIRTCKLLAAFSVNTEKVEQYQLSTLNIGVGVFVGANSH